MGDGSENQLIICLFGSSGECSITQGDYRHGYKVENFKTLLARLSIPDLGIPGGKFGLSTGLVNQNQSLFLSGGYFEAEPYVTYIESMKNFTFGNEQLLLSKKLFQFTWNKDQTDVHTLEMPSSKVRHCLIQIDSDRIFIFGGISKVEEIKYFYEYEHYGDDAMWHIDSPYDI